MSTSFHLSMILKHCTSHLKTISSPRWIFQILKRLIIQYPKWMQKTPQLTKYEHFHRKMESEFLIFLLLPAAIWLHSTLTDSVFKFYIQFFMNKFRGVLKESLLTFHCFEMRHKPRLVVYLITLLIYFLFVCLF